MNSDLSGLAPVYRSRLLVIRSLIEEYDGTVPFHHYLKNVFAKNRQYGSTDRKIYRSWCYAWFRMGKVLPDLDFFRRLLAGNYLVHGLIDDFSTRVTNHFFGETLLPDLSLLQRLEHIQKIFPEFRTEALFPFNELLSEGILREQLALSVLMQPRVFVRVIHDKLDFVKRECKKLSIPFEEIIEVPNCLSFEAAVNLDKLPGRDLGYFEIQDRSSQIAGSAIPALAGESWWDCCCGAGGKSLQLLQNVKDIHLTASDIRKTILENFASRLTKVNAGKVRLIEMDIIKDEPLQEMFDGIVVDAPCSGSGTWSRTPEHIIYYKADATGKYADNQLKILNKVSSSVKPGGKIIYITCSVFKSENEDVVNAFMENIQFELISREVINGTTSRADCMFYAVFVKKS